MYFASPFDSFVVVTDQAQVYAAVTLIGGDSTNFVGNLEGVQDKVQKNWRKEERRKSLHRHGNSSEHEEMWFRVQRLALQTGH